MAPREALGGGGSREDRVRACSLSRERNEEDDGEAVAVAGERDIYIVVYLGPDAGLAGAFGSVVVEQMQIAHDRSGSGRGLGGETYRLCDRAGRPVPGIDQKGKEITAD